MATSLQDAKIQVTLDTREAKRALKNLENQLDPGKMSRLRTIAQKQKGKDDSKLFVKFMNQITGRVPGPPGASHAARLAAQSGAFSKVAVAGIAGGTIGAFKAIEFGPSMVGGAGRAMGESLFGKIMVEEFAGLTDKLGWLDDHFNALSESFTVLENSVTQLFTAGKAASAGVLMASGAGIPEDADFFKELFNRQYEIAQAKANLDTAMTKVVLSRGAEMVSKMVLP